LAQGLRSKVGLVLGLVLPETPHETFASFVLHTERACAALGYNLIVGNTNGQPEAEAVFIDSLLRRSVEGIIFSRVTDRSNVLEVLRRWKTPAVMIDRALEREEIPTVVLDNFKAGEMAADHLISLGHKRFGVISGPQNIAISRERLNGFSSTIEKRGLALMFRDVYEGDFGYDSGVRAGESFVGKGITAIWGQNDLMAIGAMNAIKQAGLDIPRDVSVMGMDNADFSRMTLPSLTTLSQPFQEMCRTAVEMIITMKTGGTLPSHRIVLQPSLVSRDSTAVHA
jgi:DNA-binding LacI/PurR family transcriptional regulator